MSKTIWFGFLCLFVLVAVVWITESRLYDKDLEADHIRETGLTWKQVEASDYDQKGG